MTTEECAKQIPAQRGGYVLVEFKGHRRALFMNPFEFPFCCGDLAIVEADRGQDAGNVRNIISTSHIQQEILPEFTVIRRATSQDFERLTWLRDREKYALDVCNQRVHSHELPMQLVDAEYRFDGLKLTFFFTSESRVDFRELVRDLAGTFRTRIELRQIGARDEVKRWDSYGVCGCRLCCVTFINSFQPITTFMAKTQNLILNPTKLSGVCGRLKCCLGFEFSQYEDASEEQPSLGILDSDDEIEDIDKISD